MKIGIVCGHFMPEVGYQEVYLARALTRLGHEVMVFTSNKPSPSANKVISGDYPVGINRSDHYGYSVLRLQAAVSLGASVLCKGLKRAVDEFSPHLVIAIGVGKLFPYSILQSQTERRYGLISLFGDKREFWDWSTLRLAIASLRSILLHKALKNMVYVKAIRTCDRICLYTPETESILISYLPRDDRILLSRKKLNSTLGFDPEEFNFDEKDRQEIRQELDIPDNEAVFVTSTRVTRGKDLEGIIDVMTRLRQKGERVHYVLIGFLGDTFGKELKSYIDAQPGSDIFHCFPFLPHERIRKIYCAADAGIWLWAAISIQEAMGTGLPVIIQNTPVVNHLVLHGVNGWYFEKGTLSQTIQNAVSEILSMEASERVARRREVRAMNARKLSYSSIADRILKDLENLGTFYGN